ncbi:right-handed parallel beta-helix repeat-containing protein [Agrilutibacter solisilvae]|uniref:Right-handed parallel beta-helix repeat-containing protein n=1 Tax=Agrilutibacter solisilvae TaxID=2763317 RepID=A0A975ARM0_9GAMM|nr:right-handed parallel beta-helix repeat-containing protein [Lysobacter solisilvae]QSX77797.1 right-handed parallel beta-helix repeat-containing protein [Lysobacter solisilvae]
MRYPARSTRGMTDAIGARTTSSPVRALGWVLGALLASLGFWRPAQAETVANCVGFIGGVPTSISTPGVWCMDQDVSTAITTGNAVTILTNNVTLDCNGFKIGGTAAGPATQAVGVFADSRLNVTLRNCNVRGFQFGVLLFDATGGGGHVVEGNRLDGNTNAGLWIGGDGSVVRDNRVANTGGVGAVGSAWGILVRGRVDVIGNVVSGVNPSQTVPAAGFGIQVLGSTGSRVAGNIVRGVMEGTGGGAPGGAASMAIDESSGRVLVQDNSLFYTGTANFSLGLKCYGNAPLGVARGNDIIGFAFPFVGCADGGGNQVH